MRKPDPLTIRPMSRRQLDHGVDWAAAEGWNPGLHDADSFHATDPEGFLVGSLGDEPVGMISAVKYGADFGFLGFYIVRPDYRGRGYGLALWNAAMHALKGRLVGLDGVVAQQGNYRKSGFALAYNNVRYQGVLKAGDRGWQQDPNIIPLDRLSFDTLRHYDAPFFPCERRRFLKNWITQTGSRSLAYVDQGQLVGYGVIRPCRAGYKIGPLFADKAHVADRLLQALAANLPKDSVVQLDLPEVNAAAVALARAHGMEPVFETARMYTGTAPVLAVDRMFGITTFELG